MTRKFWDKRHLFNRGQLHSQSLVFGFSHFWLFSSSLAFLSVAFSQWCFLVFPLFIVFLGCCRLTSKGKMLAAGELALPVDICVP